MWITFIVLSVCIIVIAILILSYSEKKRKNILKTDGDILQLCKEEWERQHELMKNNWEVDIIHNQKYEIYDKWMTQKNGIIYSTEDCLVITIAVLQILNVADFAFFHQGANMDEIILPFVICSFLVSVIGGLLGGIASLLVERLYKGKKRGYKYWAICLTTCLALIFVVLLLIRYENIYNLTE